jgi:hypothetical protein
MGLKEVDMSNDELKKEIIARFEKEIDEILKKYEKTEIIFSDQKPTKYSFMKYLGKVGNGIVYMFLGVMGIIIYFEALMDLPEAIDKAKIRFPKQYELVIKIKDDIDRSILQGPSIGFPNELDTNEPSFQVVFNEKWLDDKMLFEEDKIRFMNHDFIASASSGTLMVSSDATSTTMAQTISTDDERTS